MYPPLNYSETRFFPTDQEFDYLEKANNRSNTFVNILAVCSMVYFLIWWITFIFSMLKWGTARIIDSDVSKKWWILILIISFSLPLNLFIIFCSFFLGYNLDFVIIYPYLITILLWIIVFSKPSIATEPESTDQLPTDNPETEKVLPKSEIEIWFEKKLSLGYDKAELLQEIKRQGYPEDFVQRLGDKY